MADREIWDWDASPPLEGEWQAALADALKKQGEIRMENAPVAEVETPKVDAPTPAASALKPEAPKPSPAQDLRNIQMLLVSGIYPGNIAPQVVAAYQLLEKMAQKVEEDAKANESK